MHRTVIRLDEFRESKEFRKAVSKIPKNSHFVLSLYTPPSKTKLAKLQQDLVRAPDEIIVRFFEDSPKSYDFLSIFKSTKTLNFQLGLEIRDLTCIAEMTKLENLILGETSFSKVSLSPLSSLRYLKSLYVKGDKINLEALALCKSLEDIKLESWKKVDLSIFKNLTALKSLNLTMCKVTNLSDFEGSQLESLCLCKIRDISDLTFVGSMINLTQLSLSSFSQVTCLPKLTKLKKLQRIELIKMSGLHDLSVLLTAPSLKELIVEEAHQDILLTLGSLKAYPTLKSGRLGLGSQKLNEKALELLPLKPDT